MRGLQVAPAIRIAAAFFSAAGLGLFLGGVVVTVVAADRGVLADIRSATADLSGGDAAPVTVPVVVLLLALLTVVWIVVMTAIAAATVVLLNVMIRRYGGFTVDIDREVHDATRAMPGTRR